MRRRTPTRLTQGPSTASPTERVVALEEEASKLSLLLEMSQALSAEKELDRVMELVVQHTTGIMGCDRSSVLLYDKEKEELYSLVAQGLDVNELRFSVNTGIAGCVARHGVLANVNDAYKDPRFNPYFDRIHGYRTVSLLTVPMQDRRGETVGVIQCLNKKTPRGTIGTFDKNDEMILTSLSTQATFYLENMALYRQMDKLFEAFVEATSRSIDDRDPCTSGHSKRVTLYSLNLAKAVHESNDAPFDMIEYTRERMRQLRYASLLHDVGKIGVREHILSKAQKLNDSCFEAFRQRLNRMREKSRADILLRCLEQKLDHQAALKAEYEPLCAKIDTAIHRVETISAGGYLFDPDEQYLRTLEQDGWITAQEHHNLSVKRGNLTSEEIADMQSHVTKSFLMLKQIPWPHEIRDVPEVAYTHHEKIDGSGYPRKLKDDEIHFDGQIMCVADIYDALTAADRPYKRATPHESAKRILMEEEAGKGRIMPDLVKLFFEKECFKI